MSLHYLVKHEIAIFGTWKRYFCNIHDVDELKQRLIVVWTEMKQSVINKQGY